MKERLRVLLISYLPPTVGGIATWAGVLRDHAKDSECSLRFVEVSGKRDHGYLGRTIKAFQSILLIARFLNELFREDLDVIHLNCCHSALGIWRDLVMAGMARALRVPLIVHYHGSLPDVFHRFSPAPRFALRSLIRCATMNIGITRGSVDLLVRRSAGRKVAYLPNFIEDDWLDRSARRGSEATRRSRFQAIYVGTLSRDKGTLDLLAVARALPDVDFLLVGDMREEVKAAIESASSNLIARPALPRRQAMELLFDSDIFVFPSRRPHEGFPNAVLEAMAAGLPVISSRVGAVAEMIEEGRGGWLVAPGDVKGLADAFRRLLANPELLRRMGTNNRQVCGERFRFSLVFTNLVELYRAAAGEKPPEPVSLLSGTPILKSPAGSAPSRQVSRP